MVDAVFVVVIEFWRISKIYVIVEPGFSSTFRERRRRLRLHFSPAVPVFGKDFVLVENEFVLENEFESHLERGRYHFELISSFIVLDRHGTDYTLTE
jgi:hypothetical protein